MGKTDFVEDVFIILKEKNPFLSQGEQTQNDVHNLSRRKREREGVSISTLRHATTQRVEELTNTGSMSINDTSSKIEW